MSNPQYGNHTPIESQDSDSAKGESCILYGEGGEDVIIVRVIGRGNLDLSPQLKILASYMNRKDYSARYIIDLEECTTMDSTFMGVLAAMAMHQISCLKDRLIVLHANTTTRRQMDTLGLKYVLSIRETATGSPDPASPRIDYKVAESVTPSRAEHIAHMIESHQALIEMDSGNRVKFEGVLKLLNQSLNREKNAEGK